MNKNQLKSEVLEYIKAHAGTSFVEIERVFEENNFDYKGDGAYTSGQHPNVVFWVGWNQEAFDVIAELKKDGHIEMDICEPIVYMVDGKGLDLPIVRSKNIKTDHWLPVTFTISKKETECV
ncbi:pathogenicity island protein [Staphylococcus aureus]|uniref:pathogenicity island protein n=1 Tax=Staphylococcus aureus TaxID=1280 RepID=UPI0022B9A45E|nr:pathogenicity island protein [Staphylococcus aureus]